MDGRRLKRKCRSFPHSRTTHLSRIDTGIRLPVGEKAAHPAPRRTICHGRATLASTPEYRLRWDGSPEDIHAEVCQAAAESSVSLHTFLRTGEFVRVLVDEFSERFVTLPQQFAMNGVVVEASEADPPWHNRADP
jgi:hypothetical protein